MRWGSGEPQVPDIGMLQWLEPRLAYLQENFPWSANGAPKVLERTLVALIQETAKLYRFRNITLRTQDGEVNFGPNRQAAGSSLSIAELLLRLGISRRYAFSAEIERRSQGNKLVRWLVIYISEGERHSGLEATSLNPGGQVDLSGASASFSGLLKFGGYSMRLPIEPSTASPERKQAGTPQADGQPRNADTSSITFGRTRLEGLSLEAVFRINSYVNSSQQGLKSREEDEQFILGMLADEARSLEEREALASFVGLPPPERPKGSKLDLASEASTQVKSRGKARPKKIDLDKESPTEKPQSAGQARRVLDLD